jgi:hypothetical protein
MSASAEGQPVQVDCGRPGTCRIASDRVFAACPHRASIASSRHRASASSPDVAARNHEHRCFPAANHPSVSAPPSGCLEFAKPRAQERAGPFAAKTPEADTPWTRATAYLLLDALSKVRPPLLVGGAFGELLDRPQHLLAHHEADRVEQVGAGPELFNRPFARDAATALEQPRGPIQVLE